MSEQNELTASIFQVIRQVTQCPLESITLATKIEDLVEDSIQLFQLILAFEDTFGMQANYEDLMAIVTVGDIVEYLGAQK